MPFTESNYENAVLQLFTQNLGYSYAYGPDIQRDYDSPLYEDELLPALRAINPALPQAALDDAVYKLKNFASGSLLQKNMVFTDYLQNGVPVKFVVKGEERAGLVYLVDYQHPENNRFIAANQWTVVENSEKRADVVLFVNGLPLVVVELKSPSREETDASAGDTSTAAPAQETADKSNLEIVVQKALHVQANQDKYMAENWQQLVDALTTAKDVLADGDAMQEDVDQAAQALLDAILAQRFKADKSILEGLISKAEGMNLEGYTAQSVAAFRSALASAQTVLADNSLSEDDQTTVDNAVAALSAAMDGLTAEGETQPSDKPEATDKPEASQTPEATNQPQSTAKPQATQKPENKVPQTGDNSGLMLWSLVCLASLAGAGCVVSTKKKWSK